MRSLARAIAGLMVVMLCFGCTRAPVSYRIGPDPSGGAQGGHVRVNFSPPAHKATLFVDQAPVADLDANVGKVLIRGLTPGSHTIEVRSFKHDAKDAKSVLIAEGEVTDVVLRGPEQQSKSERNTGLILGGIVLVAGFVLLFVVLANSL